jgi:hypothetical protein
MTRLDWSGRDGKPAATLGEPGPCRLCGQPALLRAPGSDVPEHKVCAEADIERRADAIAGRGA